jgi:SNF2 family DNA or RNA helicase
MGTGKSKVVIDAIRILQCKALILAPLVALDNWVKEVEFHGGGELTAIAYKATSRTKKLDLLTTLGNYDIVVVSYDTAKIYGTPRLFPDTLEQFGRLGGKTLSTPIRRLLSQVNNIDLQASLARDWLRNVKKPKDLQSEITEYIQNRPQWLLHLPYTMIVADESHRIANKKSIRTEVCTQLGAVAARRVLLSGTMVKGDPRHAYPQLKFLAPYLVPEDWMKFQETYLVKSPWNPNIVTGFRRLHVLNERIASVTSSRTLDECVDLPARRIEPPLTFKLSSKQRTDYNYLVRNTPITLPDSTELDIANGAVRNGKLLQICSGFIYTPTAKDICDACPYMRDCVAEAIKPGTTRCGARIPKTVLGKMRQALRYASNPKLDLLVERLKDLVATDKVIVWGCLTEELDMMSAAFTAQKWGHVRIDGSSTSQMQKWQDKFTSDEDCRIWLAQISTGIAVTLNVARYMFYFSRDYSTDNRHQSLDRNYRIGQKQKTVVYDLCAERSIEIQQLTALSNKDEISSLLTEKVECALCNQYVQCCKEGIEPWGHGCVLETEKKRVVMKARTL